MYHVQSHSFAATDIGLARKNNEDRYFRDDTLKLYAVADGMGGHAAGEVAAELAVKSVSEFIHSGHKLLASTVDEHDDALFLAEFAKAAVEHAAAELHYVQNQRPECEDMGTTLTLLLLAGQNAVIAHVGDSRAYRIRNGKVEQLTKDHTLGAMMIEDAMDRDTVPKRYNHLLVRSLGHQVAPEVDVRVESLRDGDRFLLCSDGLSNHFTVGELSAIIDDEQSLEVIVENLISVSKMVGGGDNLTAVMIEATSAIHIESTCTLIDRIAELFHRALHYSE